MVGLVHSSDEASNERGTKGLAYSRFFRDTCNHWRRYRNMETKRKDIKYQLRQGYKLQTIMHYVNRETLIKQHEKRANWKSQWQRNGCMIKCMNLYLKLG